MRGCLFVSPTRSPTGAADGIPKCGSRFGAGWGWRWRWPRGCLLALRRAQVNCFWEGAIGVEHGTWRKEHEGGGKLFSYIFTGASQQQKVQSFETQISQNEYAEPLDRKLLEKSVWIFCVLHVSKINLRIWISSY